MKTGYAQNAEDLIGCLPKASHAKITWLSPLQNDQQALIDIAISFCYIHNTFASVN